MATTDSVGEQFRRENGALELLSAALWHKSAPKKVRKRVASGDGSGGWAAWVKHLARRKRPAPLGHLLRGKGWPLLWGVSEGADRPQLPGRLAQAGRSMHNGPPDASLEKEVLQWLGEAAGRGPEVRFALEAVGWSYALPCLGTSVSCEVWWEVVDHLVSTAIEAADLSLEASPLVHQLLAGELSATLARQLPEITPCRKLARGARRALSAGLVDLTDGRGFLHARHLPWLRPLLACWTRCRALAADSGGKSWNKVAEGQYRRLVRNALRLSRHDGSQAFLPSSSEAADADLLRAAVRLGGDKKDRQIAAWNVPGGKRLAKKRVSTLALPNPAVHSEWAAATVLRRHWRRASERLCVVYPGREVRIELAAGRDVFFSGLWDLAVSLDGRPAHPAADWREVCWFSDDDVDYLELEGELTGGLRVQRHMLLARDDHFLLLADSVLAQGPSRIDYRGRLPLWAGVRFEPAADTREGVLAGGKRRALVMPLALPEWQIDRRIGDLVCTDAGLELSQSVEGSGLMAPLFFDLAPRRITRRLTWRQLTVAESLKPVRPDLAVGYRVAAGRAQWLIYRSIGPQSNRSVLGQNFSNELVVARFRRSGEVEPLLELE